MLIAKSWQISDNNNFICYFSDTPAHRWISCCSWAAVNLQDKVFKKLAAVPLLQDQLYRERLVWDRKWSLTFQSAGWSQNRRWPAARLSLFSSGSGEEWKERCFQRGRKDASSPGITRCLAGFDLKKPHKFPESSAEPRVRQSVGIFHRCLLRTHKKWLFTGSLGNGGKLCCRISNLPCSGGNKRQWIVSLIQNHVTWVTFATVE